MHDAFNIVIAKLFSIPIWKAFSIFVLTFVSFMLGNVYNMEVLGVVMLMFIDFVTGIIATKYEGRPITSRRMSHSVVKCIVYFLAISAGKFLDQTIPGEIVQYATISFVAVTEFTSIMENIGRMGFETPQKILNVLKDKYQKSDR